MPHMTPSGGDARTLGIYAHVPFCARRCDYCDFFVVPGTLRPETAEAYFRDLVRDLAASLRSPEASGLAVDTLYVGGGTPSFVPPRLTGWFLDRVREICSSVEPGAEVTLEANPESVTPESAGAWREAGVNRLSLGAQSFDDTVLAPRGRLHTAQGTREAFLVARGAGFDNIGIDLIGGLPGETMEGFGRGLDTVIALGPEHVSVYLLETAESGKNSPLARAVSEGRSRAADEEDLASMYELTVDRLTRAGYEHYEISNFARPGRVSRHNMKYWRSTPWIGLGPSAHSFVGDRRLAHPAGLDPWIQRLDSGAGREDYTLATPGQRAREAFVLEMRLLAGVDIAEFARRWGLDPAVDLAQTLDELAEAGLLRRAPGRVALTPRGVLLSNEVFGRIL